MPLHEAVQCIERRDHGAGSAAVGDDIHGAGSQAVDRATQIAKQWRDHSSAGVSTWLFVGQMAASVGFTIYSLLVRNWVFAVTNGIMILNALIGYGITVRHKKSGQIAVGSRQEMSQKRP